MKGIPVYVCPTLCTTQTIYGLMQVVDDGVYNLIPAVDDGVYNLIMQAINFTLVIRQAFRQVA